MQSVSKCEDGSLLLVMQDGRRIKLTPDEWHDAFRLVAALMYEDKPTDIRQYARDAKIREELKRVSGLLEELLST